MDIKETRKYLVGADPSKADNDVYKALVENAINRNDLDSKLKKFPNLFLWVQVRT